MDVPEDVAAVKRSGGVTAAAVVATLGSLFTLLVAIMMASVPIPPSAQGVNMRAFGIGLAVFLAGLAGLGFWTSAGLYKLRPWARMSILGFAVIMTAMAAITIVFFALMPLPVPPGRDPSIARKILPGMIAVYSVPLLIGVWWLVLFTRPATKAAFAASGPLGSSARPLSISIIGWLHLIGGLFIITLIAAGIPMLVAGEVLTGWQSRVGYFVLGAVSAYIGWGLLKLKESTRKFAIGYIVVTSANGLLLSIVPSMRDKMTAIQNSIRPTSVPPYFDQGPKFIVLSVLFALVFAGGTIWFLVKNKAAFDKENPRIAS